MESATAMPIRITGNALVMTKNAFKNIVENLKVELQSKKIGEQTLINDSLLFDIKDGSQCK